MGAPQSGGAFVRAAVWENLERLERDGVFVPGKPALRRRLVRGASARLQRALREHDSAALVLLEHLGPSDTSGARSFVEALAKNGRDDVHLVITARPLAAQLPQAWRHRVQAGSTARFDEYVGALQPSAQPVRSLPKALDPLAMARRWDGVLPPDRIHVVISRDDDVRLWERFCRVLGVGDPAAYDLSGVSLPVELGPDGVELVRRVNQLHDSRLVGRWRRPWVRELFAGDVLRGRPPDVHLTLPAWAESWVQARSTAIADGLRAGGYDIVGGLDELAHVEAAGDTRRADEPREEAVEELTRWAIARLQELWVNLAPQHTPPDIGIEDGLTGLVDLMEHCRAASTQTDPRPADRATRAPRRWVRWRRR